MISKMRSMTFVLLLIMLFSGVVHGSSVVTASDMGNDDAGLEFHIYPTDGWFINLFYPHVYPVPGSTTWFDYKTGLPDRTSNALSDTKLASKGVGTPMISPPDWYLMLDEYRNRPDRLKTEDKIDVETEPLPYKVPEDPGVGFEYHLPT